MGQELAIQSDRQFDGRALASLSEGHRDFVLKLMELGPSKKAASKAAEAVGYNAMHGYVLMRDDRVLAAIREEATKQLAGGVLIGVKALIAIAGDKKHRDRFKAAKELAGMNGFTTEQRIVVEHVDRDTKAQLIQVRKMAKDLGMGPEQTMQLIAAAGIIDAEFTEVDEEDMGTPSTTLVADDSA